MKNKYVILCLLLWISLSVSAQDIIASFIDKHEKDENLEVVSIGKRMIRTLDSMTTDNPDLKEAIKGLEAIRIVSAKDRDRDLDREYYDSARELLSQSSGLKEFCSIDEKDKELVVMIRKSKDTVKELILLLDQPEEFSLISISGTINLDVLLKYSEGLNIKELKQLKSIKNNNNKQSIKNNNQ